MFYVIRYGKSDGVALEVTAEDGVKILSGEDGINDTIKLDAGEARELAELILEELAIQFPAS